MATVSVGAQAPDFEARTADGSSIRLSDLKGRWVLVYFYPKDDTPGCTVEACSLNENLGDLQGAGAEVIGVSTQDDASHDKFRAKYGLAFALAADTDRSITQAYGVGKAMGVLPLASRQSFLIDPEGKIAHVWETVTPKTHAADVLETVKRLAAEHSTSGV